MLNPNLRGNNQPKAVKLNVLVKDASLPLRCTEVDIKCSGNKLTYVVAECRLDSLMSVVFFEGESSSTGEMKPSASSSMCSRKPMTLISGCTLTVNCVFESPSSSEPSSSSCRSIRDRMSTGRLRFRKRPRRAVALKTPPKKTPKNKLRRPGSEVWESCSC